MCAAESKLRAVLTGKYHLFIYRFHVLGQTTLIRDNLFYFRTSGRDPWIRNGPEKFGTLGIFGAALSQTLMPAIPSLLYF